MANTKPSDNNFLLFLKTTVAPILIALVLYLLLFHALLPLYRRHRARYSQYLPLTSLQPTTLSTRARSTIFRILFPSHWARSTTTRRLSTSSTTSHPENDLFTDESGEAMVGFDLPPNRGGTHNTRTNQGVNRATSTSPSRAPTHPQEDPTPQSQRRRRDDINRYATRNILAAREMNASTPTTDTTSNIFTYNDPPPERRLSRELEEVFRDDSGDEDSDDEVTVGRRRVSMSVDRHVTR
jgi:hypothetical protein